jgi:hypothetical protein
MHTRGGGGVIRDKSVSSLQIFTTPIYPPSQNLAKTLLTLPLDFQTVCIYDFETYLLFYTCVTTSFYAKSG